MTSRQALTAAQSGIWWGQQLDPHSKAYWAAEYVELVGALDASAMERALDAVLRETEALQQRLFEAGGQLWQEPRPCRFELGQVDLRAHADPHHAALELMAQDLETPVELESGALFASMLVRVADERYYWYLRAHHIALDGYGFDLLQRRVSAAYDALSRGRTLSAPPAATLAALVAEDQRYRASRSFERDRDFWCTRLVQQPEPSLLAPARALSRQVLRQRRELPGAELQRWQAAAHELGVDLTSWLCAAVMAFISARTGENHQTLGLPVTGRLGSAAAALPSMMMNILPLPLRWNESTTFAELTRLVAGERRAAQPYQRYRYEDLKRDLECAKHGRRLFGPVLNFMPFEPLAGFGNLVATKHPVAAGPVEDLALVFAPSRAGCRVDLEANPNAYRAEALAEHAAELVQSLNERAAAPGLALSARRRARRASLLVGEALAPAAGVLESLLAAEARFPHKPAIEQDGREPLDYAGLLAAAQALAARLQAAGAGPERLVAILLPRCPEAIVAQLAALWVGAAYLPLDPQGPSERLRYVLDDARPLLVVTSSQYAELAGGVPLLCTDAVSEPLATAVSLAPRTAAASALAYVIYTSGSTGRPNGVMIARGAWEHFVAAARERYAMTAADRVLQFAPLHFDASVEEIWVTLASAGTLVLRSEAMLDSVAELLASCRRLAISVLDLPTAYFHELVLGLAPDAPLPAELRLVIIGGEAVLLERVARWRALGPSSVTLLNTYGPTETTVVCSTAALVGPGVRPLEPGADAAPIGLPLAGVTLAVISEAGEVVAAGEPGELCVLGPTLARGYLGNPQASEQRFVSLDGLAGSPRGYRTGDRVELARDGRLVYLGRLDDELKLSGHRVSPLEVEQALLSVPSVQAAAVVVAESASKRLVAFVVSAQLDTGELRRELGKKLAAPAIPSRFVALAQLPLDANGKVDRRLLRDRAAETAEPGVLAATPLEQVVLRIWSEVLGETVTASDVEFFALGGSSLSALQVATRLGRALGRQVPLSALFREPTVAGLARALELPSDGSSEYLGQDPLAPFIALQSGQGRPLFCVHPADGLAWCYLGLGRELPSTTLFALQAPGLTGAPPAGFDELVSDYLELVRQAQSQGPYRLLGWSSGGGIAHALACRLRAQGETVELLALLDAYPADIWQGKPAPTRQDALLSMLDEADATAVLARAGGYTSAELVERLRARGSSLGGFDEATLARMVEVALHSMLTYRSARHARSDADVLFFRAARRSATSPEVELWRPYTSGRLEVVDVDATHLGMCSAPALAQIGVHLRQRL